MRAQLLSLTQSLTHLTVLSCSHSIAPTGGSIVVVVFAIILQARFGGPIPFPVPEGARSVVPLFFCFLFCSCSSAFYRVTVPMYNCIDESMCRSTKYVFVHIIVLLLLWWRNSLRQDQSARDGILAQRLQQEEYVRMVNLNHHSYMTILPKQAQWSVERCILISLLLFARCITHGRLRELHRPRPRPRHTWRW